MSHAERGLQPDDPEWRVVEGGFLGVVGMRGMVGGDAVDHALLERLAQRRDVRRFAQRRVYFWVRIVAPAVALGEREVVRGGLGGGADPPLFGAPRESGRITPC